MQDTPLLSVCCVTYQHAAFIRQSVESMLAQETPFPFEICIGEDESQDGTREVCQELASKDKRIRLFLRSQSDPNRRTYAYPAAYNWLQTLRACRGLYVAELEGDDYWTDSRKLQKQVAFLEANPDYTLSFHNALVIYQNADIRPHLFNRKPPRTLSARQIIEHEWLIPSASIVVRRTVVDRLPDDFRTFPSGDLALSILAAAAGKVHGFEECMSVYRKNQGGASHVVSVDAERAIQYWERVNAMLASLDRALRGDYHRSFEKRILQNLRRIDYVRLKHGIQFSPRLLWNSLRFIVEHKIGR